METTLRKLTVGGAHKARPQPEGGDKCRPESTVEELERLKWEAHEKECESAAMALLNERKRPMAYILKVGASDDYSKTFATLTAAKKFGENLVNEIPIFDDNVISILNENGDLILLKKVIDNDWTGETNAR
jgi:hypothetical protein